MPSPPPSRATPARVFRALARLHVLAQRETLAQARRTFGQCNVLSELRRGGPVSLVALTGRLRLDKAWVSRTIEHLVKEGLVTRQADVRDRRAVRLALTARGQRASRALDALLDRQVEGVFARLPARQRAEVGRALTLLTKAYREEFPGPTERSHD